ncbi:MAG: hypothetical protein F6K35_03790 [Okeania sp. SIO2H7]|nr:hypothetical protein [Okeania sp. SIO2H7]
MQLNNNYEEEYNNLIVSAEIKCSQLLLAVCNNLEKRQEIINRYSGDLKHFLIEIQPDDNWAACVNNLTNQNPDIISIIGIEKLQTAERPGNKTKVILSEEIFYWQEDSRSELDVFLGYLQWQREKAMRFNFPIVSWLTDDLERKIITKAPDFYSWRRGVFRF